MLLQHKKQGFIISSLLDMLREMVKFDERACLLESFGVSNQEESQRFKVDFGQYNLSDTPTQCNGKESTIFSLNGNTASISQPCQ